MGAQVIKIRTPGIGDSSRQYGSFLNDEPHGERSGLYLYLNSNKKGITLNLETPAGRSILRDLVSQADALVHNLQWPLWNSWAWNIPSYLKPIPR